VSESGRYYFRLNLYHRILHGMVVVSFLGLALTGLPLRYAETRWGLALSWLLGGPGTTRYLHRVFALVQLLQHLRYFVGLGPRPRFGRWTYWEKFDYWAVFWGVAIIGASGLLLWFPTFFARYLPGWIFNLAIIVHGDEALLAVGFIFSVHFFNANLRPEKFPMDPVIFTGRIEEEEFRREHPEEYERLAAEGALDGRRADRPPLWLRTFARVAGLAALVTGLIVLYLIVLTALR
jgi:cytochrome b subunit of formate dehydrogenase